MKGASKVIMGATVVMVVSLAVVLTLVLVLLAELYCNLILRRRQQRLESASSLIDTPAPTTVTAATTISSSPSVLQAPRTSLFPATKEAPNHIPTTHMSHQSLHHVLELYSPRDDSSSNAATTQKIGDVAAVEVPPSAIQKEHLIYISNPIYDNSRISNGGGSAGDTPFETPDSSPSRLVESSSDEEVACKEVMSSNISSLVAHPLDSNNATPPLTPMKKLPAEASSVSLRDGRSLGTWGSDSVSNKNEMSSSSSGTPCTSPSW
ncbi:hypothetical protein LINPERHAP2_LOCUS33215 [Linum perenne]